MIKRMRHTTLDAVEAEVRDLIRDVHAAKSSAHELLQQYHPELSASAPIASLSENDAQLVIARQYGFVNWRQLETFVIATNGGDADKCFTKIACLNYLRGDDRDCRLAEQMLADDPGLASRDIYHACCVGDVAAVETLLSSDPTLVYQAGGYFGWEPLLYACYSRLDLPDKSTLDVVRVLLANGADPNAHYMWGGHYRFTALTGVFGEGEGGAVNYPEHPQCETVARALLEAGADPNDSQALYNRMFTPSSVCLEMLLEFGLGSEAKNNWFIIDGNEIKPEGRRTLRYQLDYAIKSGFVDRARMLIDHGADLSNDEGPAVYETAMLHGETELAEYLLAKGAIQSQLSPEAEFQSACMRGDEAAARTVLAANADLSNAKDKLLTRLISEAASAGKADAVRTIAALGGDLNRGCPLCQAAWSGDRQMVELLVELGANPRTRDAVHDATAMQWANHHSERDDIIEYLATCDIDIFDAIIAGNVPLIEKMLDADPSLLETTLADVRLESGLSSENNNHTPLVSAVVRGKSDIVRMLLERGAKIDYTSGEGKSLADLAHDCLAADLVELLENG